MRPRRRWYALMGCLAVMVAGAPAVAAAASACTQPAETSYTWVGSSQDPHADNHSWTDPLNWDPQGVPKDGDSVAIAPPDGDHCAAHVDGVPAVQLQQFTLTVAGFCSASVTGGPVEVSKLMTWDSGVIDTPVVVDAGGQALITGGEDKELSQNFTVDGTLSLVGATVQLDDPHSVSVDPGGTLESAGDSLITFQRCCGDPAHVLNKGTVSVTGTLQIDAVQFDQRGTVALGSGDVLQLTKAPMTASNGARYTGSGRMRIWTQTDAVMNGKQNLGKGFHLELGDDGSSGASLGGTATFTGTGTFDWSGGTLMANLTIAHGVKTVLSGANDGNGRRLLFGQDTSSGKGVRATVTAHGPIVVDQHANLFTQYRAHLVVAADGSLSLAPGTGIDASTCCTRPDTITNDGGTIGVPADTAGDGPAVLDGVAYAATGGTTSIAKGAELQLTGRPRSALSDTTITGGGMLTVIDPTTVAKTVTVDSGTTLHLAGSYGSLDGTATVGGEGTVLWTGGALSGHLTIGAKGGLTLSGDETKEVDKIHGGRKASTVTVTAPMTMAKGTKTAANPLDAGGSSMTFGGKTTINAYAELVDGRLTNTGTLAFTAGAKGTVDVDYNVVLVNQGTLALQSGTVAANGIIRQASGTTTLGSGTTLSLGYSSHPLSVTGGTLTGTGLVDGDLTARGGVVDPGTAGGSGDAGALHVTGDYTQGKKAELAVDVAAKGADLLRVDGVASVLGTLLSHTMKGVHPAKGAKRTVLSATDGLTWHVTCAITSGTDSAKGHWQPKAAGGSVKIAWQQGKATSC